MPAKLDSRTPVSNRIAVRLPLALINQIRALALRDHNTLSPTIRRLISAGIQQEARDGQR